jgi:hypothetical protein
VGPNIWENRQHGPREIRPLRPAADLVSAGERPILARDLAGTVAYAGVDLNLEGHALQDALLREIAHRCGYCWWDVDQGGWVVRLASPREKFYAWTFEEALAWCLVWLMAPELGIRPSAM